MTKIINLTPHDINTITIPVSGKIARCNTKRIQVGIINNITVNKTQFGQVIDLPNPQDDTFFVVSALVANALSDRDDLLIPEDDIVRDGQGRIIGCKALARV